MTRRLWYTAARSARMRLLKRFYRLTNVLRGYVSCLSSASFTDPEIGIFQVAVGADRSAIQV